MNQTESIGVIIPVYNGLPFVTRTLQSVINQTLRPTQIIIVNDGSTDNTLEELNRIKKENPQINITIITKKNGGHSSATNEGIRASTAEYLAFVDADDLWHPTKLEKQFAIFKKSSDSKLGVVYANCIIIDPNDIPISDYPTTKLDQSARGRIFEKLLLGGNFITGSNSAILVKREVFKDHGFFDEVLKCGEDLDMWIRIAQTYHYDYSPEVLTYIRRHNSNLSNQNMLHCRSELYIIHKWRNEIIRIGGLTSIADYLSRITFANQKDLLINSEFKFLLVTIQETTNFKHPRLFIIWGMFRKIRKKIFKIFRFIAL